MEVFDEVAVTVEIVFWWAKFVTFFVDALSSEYFKY